MNINWRAILGEISGYKPLYESTLNELHIYQTRVDELTTLLTAANDTIRRLELPPSAPADPAPTEPAPPADPTPSPTPPANPTTGATTNRKIRQEQVIDCPMDARVVPLHAMAAGANHDQFTCRHCTYYEKETCDHVSCKYM